MDNLFFQKSRQEAVVSVSGSQEGLESHGRINFGPHSSSLSPAGSSGRFESVIRGYSRTLCRNAGKCVTHADPASDRQRDARAGSLRSPSLPHRGYVGGFIGVTSTVLWGLASAPQPVSLAPPYHQTRLCDR